jgi:hypothetical protein
MMFECRHVYDNAPKLQANCHTNYLHLYCTCIIYHTLTIWLSTLEDVTHFHHHNHNVHISFGDLGAGWVCQYSIESYVESYYMTRMRKKIPHKNLREKSLSMSCENRNCILLCHKKGVGRSEELLC